MLIYNNPLKSGQTCIARFTLLLSLLVFIMVSSLDVLKKMLFEPSYNVTVLMVPTYAADGSQNNPQVSL